MPEPPPAPGPRPEAGPAPPAIRVVLADDSVLFREGLARVLADNAGDGNDRGDCRQRPQTARFPPTALIVTFARSTKPARDRGTC
jgi:hypothetical protein